ncbi:MAG: ATP-binding cassette domain-containing protein [Chloroflexi bacterium]|nr:ATP-binding cassette domain-containing protein [Chloroflexota bacterium]
MRNSKEGPLLRAEGLTKLFPVTTGNWFQRDPSFVHAVDGVQFDLGRGDSLGLVGESGCGKTTTGRLLVRLSDPTDGHIIFDDGEGEPTDIATLSENPLTALRKKPQMIFQDP